MAGQSRAAVEAWWTEAGAAWFVHHHFEPPWGSLRDAADWLWSRVLDGTVPARYRDVSGHCVSIASNEWLGARNWRGWNAEEHHGRGAGQFQLEAVAVKRLCAPTQLEALPPSAQDIGEAVVRAFAQHVTVPPAISAGGDPPRQERYRRQSPRLEAVRRALDRLYPAGVPDQAALRNKDLYQAMANAGVKASPATIRRAAGPR